MTPNPGSFNSPLRLLQIIFFTIVFMYFGQTLFIPLSFALLISLILYPICQWMEKHKMSRSLATAISVAIVICLFILLFWAVLWQLNYLKNDLPFIVQKIKGLLQQSQKSINEDIGVSMGLEPDWLEKIVRNSGNNISSFLQSSFKSAGNFIFSLFIVPVFIALFLYHREQFVLFLNVVFGEKYHSRLHIVLRESSYAYYKYVIGVIKVYLIVGTLNSIGLLVLGIEHAVFFGMLAAFMTIIPYIGIILSALLPVSVAWATKDSLIYPLGIIAIFSFVQYLESSVIFPKVVGQQLNVSTWAILVALTAGGIIWGVSGMVLFIPFIAILKIISDKVEEWAPLNILLSRKGK